MLVEGVSTGGWLPCPQLCLCIASLGDPCRACHRYEGAHRPLGVYTGGTFATREVRHVRIGTGSGRCFSAFHVVYAHTPGVVGLTPMTELHMKFLGMEERA